MLVGVPKFLVGKNIGLKIDFIDTNESVLIPGIIPRAEFLEGRKDITSVHIAFNGDTVPMVYKLHINSFITTYQKTILSTQQTNANTEINQPVINTAADNMTPSVADAIPRQNTQTQAEQAAPQQAAGAQVQNPTA